MPLSLKQDPRRAGNDEERANQKPEPTADSAGQRSHDDRRSQGDD